MTRLTLSSFKSRQKVRINYQKKDRFVVVYASVDDLASGIKDAIDTAFDKQLQKEVNGCDIMSIDIGEG